MPDAVEALSLPQFMYQPVLHQNNHLLSMSHFSHTMYLILSLKSLKVDCKETQKIEFLGGENASSP